MSALAELKVIFSLKSFRTDSQLFDPNNIVSVNQYYLLENLAVGLLRDNYAIPGGYEPMLSTSWQQVGSKSWDFKIRPSLVWSDGSPIHTFEIVEHFKRLSKVNSKHVKYLKYLEEVGFDQSQSTLKMTFSKEIASGLLHELSLADSALTKRVDGKVVWQVSSGPYYVSNYEPKNGVLLLEKNQHFFVPYKSPERVSLLDSPMVSLETLSDKSNFDLFSIPPPRRQKRFNSLYENHPSFNFIEGNATDIHFLNFNPSHPLTKKLKARRELQTIILGAMERYGDVGPEKFYYQMLGEGVPGWLSGYIPKKEEISFLKNQHLILNFHEVYKSTPRLIKAIIEEANKDSVHLEIKFNDLWYGSSKAVFPDNVDFARTQLFRGNQKDSVGSWSFLLSHNEALGQFNDHLAPYLEEVIEASNDDEKKSKLQHLHQQVIDSAYVIPFAIERPAVFVRKSMAIKWNMFDMRMRFFEVTQN